MNNPYTEEQDLAILKNLLKAMREGTIEELSYKRSRKNGKQFECKVRNSAYIVGVSATSNQGEHDLGYLFTNTVARAGLCPEGVEA